MRITLRGGSLGSIGQAAILIIEYSSRAECTLVAGEIAQRCCIALVYFDGFSATREHDVSNLLGSIGVPVF